jgi:tRNA pseudouridine38-40 synthase
MRAAGSSAKTSTRRLTRFEISGRAGGEIGLEVEGEGFLRHMVRNLAGTLIEIGRGRWAPGRAAEILAARDRAKAGPTAPAEGLVLVSVADDQSAGQSVAGELPSRSRSVDEGGPVG